MARICAMASGSARLPDGRGRHSANLFADFLRMIAEFRVLAARLRI
jgi:hypothetical protein